MESIIIKPKSHEEWLQFRQNGIGSSEVTTVLGINPFMTRYQLWRQKKGVDQPIQETFIMKAGHYLEDAVSRFFEDETGRKIIKASSGDWLVQSVEKPFLMASPDRTYWVDQSMTKNNSNKGICECKTTQKLIDEDDIPKHWFCQLQWQLGISGLEHGALAWLTQGRSFGFKEYLFNETFFNYMVEEVEKYWYDYILGDKVPDPETSEDVLLKYSNVELQNTIEVGDEIFNLYTELKGIREKRLHFKKQEDELLEKLKVICGGSEAMKYMGQTLATYKFGKESEKFDEDLFRKENPELYKQYVYTEQNRRFSLK